MEIVNIFVSGFLGQPVPLAELAKSDNLLTLNKNTEHCGFISLGSAKATVYLSGKCNVCGIKSISDVDLLWDKLKLHLKNNLDVSLFEKPIIKNIVAIEHFNKYINLCSLFQKLQSENIEYEPEVFPGLIWKNNFGSATIFSSGKILLMGCTNVNELETLWRFISTKLTSILYNSI